jgi:hypothetical protein
MNSTSEQNPSHIKKNIKQEKEMCPLPLGT